MTALPKPYYQDSACVIYHGDAREIVPLLTKVDLCLADPPYGHGFTGIETECPGGKRWHYQPHGKIEWNGEPFDPSHLLNFRDVVLWGANHFAEKLPSSAGWFVWDKRVNTPPNNLSDCELAWNKNGGSVRIFRHLWNGLCRDSEIGQHLHPTQKPVELMRWCIGFFPNSRTVVDPYCGSGPTLRAAKDLGRRAIGIEIEERYCEIAARRLAQEVLPLNPIPQSPRIEEPQLFA